MLLLGGTLSSTDTGRINILATSTLDGVTLASGSVVNQNNAVTTTILNGLTNNSTWNHLGSSVNTNLFFAGGSQTLDGSGEVVLNNDPQSRITGTGGQVITHGANHTIRGGGTLLGNTTGMINNGTILGNGTYPLNIDPSNDGFVNNGLLRAEAASTITILPGGFTNTQNALISGNGTLNVSAINFNNDGGVAPGTSPGILNLIGDYSEYLTATLFIEIAGTTVGDDYDRFAVSGNASLAGTLNIELLGYIPAPSDTFTILTAANVFGMFSNATSTVTTVEGHLFDITYNPHSVVLSNFVPVPEPGSLVLLIVAAGLMNIRSVQ